MKNEKTIKNSMLCRALFAIFALSGLASYPAFASDTTLCGNYGYQEESFTGPEKSWLSGVPGKGKVTLDFPGMTPYYSQGAEYCCFGNYEYGTLYVKTGCNEQ